MKTTYRALSSVVMAAAVIATAVGCGSSAPVDTPTEGSRDSSGVPSTDISGTVNWYASTAVILNDRLIAAFEAEYPNVDVQVLRATDGELAVRYEQEVASGAPTADVITVADTLFMDHGAEEGWWDTSVTAAEGFPESAVTDGFAAISFHVMGMAYNPDLLDEEPTSWEDMAKPEFKDQLVMLDPRNFNIYLAVVELWSQEYGDEFLEELAAQNFRVTPGGVPASEIVGAGGALLMAPTASASIAGAVDAGAPVQMAAIPTPSTAVEVYAGVSEGSPNAEAAAAFYHFFTTKEGQEAFNMVTSSARTDTDTATLPEGLVPISELLPKAVERRDELLSLIGLQ